MAGTPFLYAHSFNGQASGGQVMSGAVQKQDDLCDNYSNVKVDVLPDVVFDVKCCDGDDSCCVSNSDPSERLLSYKRGDC